MNKHYENIHKYDFLTKELLQEEYVGNGLTDRQIAEKYNMPSRTVIWRKRKKFGIENKCKGKSNQNAKKNRKFSISKEEAEQLIEENTFEEIASKMGCSIVVAKRRFKELGLCREQQQTSFYEYYDVDLNESQKQLIIGSVLGDGTITKSGAYSCSHSIKQKEYFDYKRQVLYNLHSNCTQKYTHSYSYLKCNTESIHFTTGCNKHLYELRNIYYPDGVKIFPYEYLNENMTKEALAYWYQDDGGKRGRKYYTVYFYTYGYSHEDNERMKHFLINKFDIKVDIKINREKRRGNRKFYLGMNRENSDKFFSLIRPHIVPCMLYKIGEQ